MCCSACPLHHSIEPIDLVSGVGDLAHVAIRLHQAVLSVHHAVLQGLRGVLVVSSRWVCYSVREAVGWVRVYWFCANDLGL